MNRSIVLAACMLSAGIVSAVDMAALKQEMKARFDGKNPTVWAERVSGVEQRVAVEGKAIALTFDACGSKNDGFDNTLISFLEREKIPATLFISVRWIENHPVEFKRIAAQPLFEIENHGVRHRPCSVNGRSVYGIAGTQDIDDLVDEVEGNGRTIESLTGRKPLFYRSGTAYYDDVAAEVVAALGYRIAGYQVLGDAGATYTPQQVEQALLSARPGDIVIMHMNHPEKGTAEGVMRAVPQLRKKGFSFVTLAP